MAFDAPANPASCPACGNLAVTSPDAKVLSESPSAHALREVLDGNDVFVSTRDPSRFAAFQESQSPFVTLLSCADSRVAQAVFNFDPFNRVFEIRDIGNQLRPVAGSIDYGVRHLNTPLLMILGHVRCGAIKAAMGDYGANTMEIIHELDDLHLPLRGDDGKGDEEARWLANVERNVDFQASICSRRYRDLIYSGKLAVLGAVYDFADLYGCGQGRVVVVNLNGSKDTKAIASHPLLSSINESVLETSVCRITQ